MSGREQGHRLEFYPKRHLLRLLLAALCVVTGISVGLVWCGISDVEQVSSAVWAYLGGAAVFLLVDVAVFMWFIREWKLRDLAVIMDVDGVAICCGSYEEHFPASAVSGACVCCGVCNTSTNFELGSLLLWCLSGSAVGTDKRFAARFAAKQGCGKAVLEYAAFAHAKRCCHADADCLPDHLCVCVFLETGMCAPCGCIVRTARLRTCRD